MAHKYKHRHTETYRGQRIDVRSDNLMDLAQKVDKKKAEIDRRTTSPETRFGAFCDTWLEAYKKGRVSDAWYKDMTAIVHNKIVPGIGDVHLQNIAPVDVQRFLTSCSDLSESYVHKIHDLTKQILRAAYNNGLTRTDCTVSLTAPRGAKEAPGRSLTALERKYLLRVIDGHRGEVFVRIMLQTGLRPSEVMALQWRDIDLENRTLRVFKSVAKDDQITPPKSKAGNRTVPIPETLAALLEERKSNPFDYVVTMANGKRYTHSARKDLWKNIVREMNIAAGANMFRNQLVPPLPFPDLKMYYLRHTYCTDLERAGVPINVARRLMGHSSIEMTSKIYTHDNEESFTDARKKLESLETVF